jgi:putative ABC transport system permease protein
MRTPARRWVVWSVRDLRRRWLLVAAIAMVISLGTGVYAALASTEQWRRQSNDASFGLLAMHDLRVQLSEGSFVDTGKLRAAVTSVAHPERVVAADERLILPTLVDASVAGKTILVPGRVVGVDTSGGGPHVDKLFVVSGQGLAQQTTPGVLLESKFAKHYGLPPSGTLKVAGGRTVRYSGTAMAPEYFLVSAQEGLAFFGEGSFAVLFAPRDAVQQLSGRSDKVNDLVLTAAPGTDLTALARDIQAAITHTLPGTGVTITDRSEDPSYKFLYDDIKGDQAVWNIVAALIFLGAAFAAFNLVTRVVEAQRREIGIGMALGAPRRQLAIRPLLVGIEVALLGVIGGLLVGVVVAIPFASLMREILPLPVWKTNLQMAPFLKAAAIGFVLPVLATVYPVWRALQVEPVDALSTAHVAARSRGGGLVPLLRRFRWRGRCLPQLPFRNLLRAPRRTLLTTLSIGAAIAVLVAVVGLGDSFIRVVDRGAAALTTGGPERVTVQLDNFYATNGPEIARISAASGIASADPGITLAGTLSRANRKDVDVVVGLLDFAHARWAPKPLRGRAPLPGEILLSPKAASDLGVGTGDTVRLRHPRRTGPTSFVLVDSLVRVSGLTANPMRPFTYMSTGDASRFGLTGTSNTLQLEPKSGVDAQAIQWSIFGLPGVAAAQPVAATQQLLKDETRQFVEILRIAEIIVLLLAVLIAFNSTSLTTEERRRDYATMFAFGLPLRRVVKIIATETFVIGVLATTFGTGLGYLLLRWITQSTVASTSPDLAIDPYLATGTIVIAVVVGVVAVTLAPLLTVRKLRHMDVPSTLRVLE